MFRRVCCFQEVEMASLYERRSSMIVLGPMCWQPARPSRDAKVVGNRHVPRLMMLDSDCRPCIPHVSSDPGLSKRSTINGCRVARLFDAQERA